MSDKAIKVLVSDKLAKEGVEILQNTPGVEVTIQTGMSPDELKVELPKYDAIIIRSATKLTTDVLSCAPNLKAIARAGVGVDNVDIPTASKNGTIVMNTPGGNTVSTAELAVTLLLSLCRHIAPACASLKEGRWDRKLYEGTEVNGKTIGIIGLGRIGCEVATRCKAFNMKVLGFDPFITEERAKDLGIKLYTSVPEMVKEVDFISVHTPMTDETRGIIGSDEFALMKDGVMVVNGARGGIIDEAALLQALESGKCAGAALDVYTKEPPEDRALVDHEKVLCTPHLGASTAEAQVSVAIDAANQIVDALKNNEVRCALNFPALSARDAVELAPFGELAYKLGSFAGQLVDGQLKTVEFIYAGEIASRDLRGVTAQFTMGLLSCFEGNVNPVSAPMLAKERGIDIRITNTESAKEFHSLLTVKIDSTGGAHEVAGVVFGRTHSRIVMVDGYYVEAVPEGTMLLISNEDRPGVIGAVGTTLGDAKINISAMNNWAREDGSAITILNIENEVTPEVIEKIKSVEGVRDLRQIRV
ncbi:MAG: phosphoglycerate dehydrogenase [Planctomycetes bacterium]|nr:phosphoglycerate dehydrogenase [Planctomycetota bacterium]